MVKIILKNIILFSRIDQNNPRPPPIEAFDPPLKEDYDELLDPWLSSLPPESKKISYFFIRPSPSFRGETVPGSEQILAGLESNSPSEEESAPSAANSLSHSGCFEGGSGDEGTGDGPGQQGILHDPAKVEDMWD